MAAADRLAFAVATAAHARELAPRLRAGDRAEVLASGGYTPLQALLVAIAWSRRHGGGAWAGLIDGQVAAIFGIGRRSLLSPHAVPWCLTGELVDRHPLLFWRASKAVIETWLEDHQQLEQHVDARYAQALRWARRLGFTVESAQPFGLSGRPFHRITLRRSSCANPPP